MFRLDSPATSERIRMACVDEFTKQVKILIFCFYRQESELRQEAYRTFSHHVMAAILVFKNNETAVMLVNQDSPLLLFFCKRFILFQ